MGSSKWKDSISIEDKVKMEHFYLVNKSLLLDIKILFLTVKHVFLASSEYISEKNVILIIYI